MPPSGCELLLPIHLIPCCLMPCLGEGSSEETFEQAEMTC